MDPESSPAAHPPHTMRLADGRTLAWAEYGDPAGAPLIFHHGIPSSRVAAAVMSAAAARNAVRLIAPDRPGFGYSDPLPDRTILDWPDDLRQLADQLGLETVSLACISAGLPYVLACGMLIPERLDRIALISGLGRIDTAETLEGMSYEWRLIYSLFLKSRRLASLWMRGYGRAVLRNPERVVAQQIKRMHALDGEVLARPDVSANRIADLRQAFRQGPAAAGEEARMHLEPWGFDIADVQSQIYLWQGVLDESHPIHMGRTIAAELPNCRPVFAEAAGSLGFILHTDAIFADLWPERAAPSAALSPDAVRIPTEPTILTHPAEAEAIRPPNDPPLRPLDALTEAVPDPAHPAG